MERKKENDDHNSDSLSSVSSETQIIHTDNNANEPDEGAASGAVPLKFNYRDDQWSPLNRSGKKQYDLEFLMQFRFLPNATKPDNIPQDLYSDKTFRSRGAQESSHPVSIMQNILLPGYARGSSSRAHVTPSRKSLHGKQNPKNGVPAPSGGKPSVIHVNLSLRSDVKLNETQNAWKPTRMRSVALTDDDISTQELFKKFRSVLNKLTPQMFDKLISQVQDLKIDTPGKLSGVIDLVFEKAIDEPSFSVEYALMCKMLEQIKVKRSPEETDNKEEFVSFRKLIVSRCQKEFEKADRATVEKQKEIDVCDDRDHKKTLQMNLEEEERKIRMRSVGNIRFIGELFKQNIITSKIMIYCIERLLTKLEEETLECLCKLLTTIGKNLEQDCKLDLSRYFSEMLSIVKSEDNSVSSRVRFMLQDVIDLRKSGWVPRRQVSKPKTMEQIQMEVQFEENLYGNFTPNVYQNRSDRQCSNINKRGASKSVTEDPGWFPVQARNSRTRLTYSVDPGKLKLIGNPTTPITQTSLQPSTFMTSWGKGSNTKKGNDSWPINKSNGSSPSKKTTTTTTSNMYTVLSDFTDSSQNRSEESSGPKLGYRTKGASIERSTFKSSNLDSPADKPKENSLPRFEKCPLSDEIFDKLEKMMVEGQNDSAYGIIYKLLRDFPLEKYSIELVVRELLLWGLNNQKIFVMEVIGEVTGRLIDDELLDRDSFIIYFREVIDISTPQMFDYNVDIWKMFALFFYSLKKKHHVKLWEIQGIFVKVIAQKKGYNLLKALFIESQEPSTVIQSWWEEGCCNMELVDWMPEDDAQAFNIDMGPFFLIQDSPTIKMVQDSQTACSRLLKFFKLEKKSDWIISWIKKYVGEAVEEPWFVRALTEAVFTYALCPSATHKPRLDDSALYRMHMNYPLLIHYVNYDKNKEIQVLFSIQRLMHKLEHPQGITVSLFEKLWESGEVVTYRSFCAWEVNDDPLEQEGKGVMLKTLTSFFTVLKTDESSDDSVSNNDDALSVEDY